MAADEDVGFEEGLPWLPAYVLDEAFYRRKDQLKYQKHQAKRHNFRSLAAADPLHQLNSKSAPRPQRTRYPTTNNVRFGGPGMQAVFLDSGRRSCGTGVFLPRRAGITDSQSSNKPARSPVLLPSRVVQALNLNVHELGLQIKPHPEPSKQYKGVDYNLHRNKKKSTDASAQYCSPEIFLPKEWTY